MSSQALCPQSSVWQVVHPLISMIGGIFVWIGVWDYIVDYLHGNTAGWDVLYMLSGLSLLTLTRTLIAQAGLKPAIYHPTSPSTSALDPILHFLSNAQSTPPTSSFASSLALYVRSLLALLAGICFWLGAYNLFDLHLIAFGPALRDLVYTAVGLLLMLLTANVASEGALVLDSAIEPTLTSSTSSSSLLKASAVLTSTRSFILYHAKALLGLYGDVLYWVGAYNLADTHSWEATPTRDALYVIVGFAVFFLVSLWTWKQRTQPQPGRRAGAGDRGGDWTPLAEEGQGGQQSMGGGLGDRMVFYARLMVTMVAGILAWVGWWNILSTWVVTDSSAVADAEEPTAEDADVGGLSQRTFRTLSRHSQHHPTSSLPHLWTLMQRSSTAESSFPMWVLYALYAFTGLVLLV